MKTPSKLVLTATVAALVLGGSYSWRQSRIASAPQPAGPPPPAVTVAPVELREIVESAEFTGRVDALETVELRPRVSGHVTAVKFQAGQRVLQGDVLFEIDARWYQAAADLAAAEFERAKVSAQLAEREQARTAELVASRTISTEDADARKLRVANALAARQAAEATLASARLDLAHTVIRAPISGRISRAYVTPGNLVSGTPGAAASLLATIVSTGEAYVYADLDERTALRFQRLLRAGGLALDQGRVPVELQLADEEGFGRRGWLESLDNRLTPSTGSLVLRAVFPNDDGALLPGLFARLRVPVGAARPTLLISERAVGTDQSQKFVFTVGENATVVQRAIKLGGTVDGLRIVREGLQPGERIVVNGLQRVRPGMTVAPQVAATAEPRSSVAQR
ncbi:MAG: efflux RND transporter periplasmic adaptor subunit [Verrucomicrobia bacterium]|nr:efflux RND transporter periplasmic adaptor subunit [Verrucomicrobiota bacterium]